MHGRELNRELVRRYRSWLNALEYSQTTVCSYVRIASEFCELLRSRELSRVTAWDVRKLLILRSEGRSYASVHYALTALRNFFEFLSFGGVADALPARSVRIRAPKLHLSRVASPLSIAKLIAAAKKPRERALVELFYATGCRVSEIAAIRTEDIDWESRKIQVRGKFGRSRYVVFGAAAARAMRLYLRGRKSGYVFRPEHLQKGSVYKDSRSDTWVGEISVYSRTYPSARQRVVIRLGPRSQMAFGQAWDIFKRRIRPLDTVRPLPRPLVPNTIRTVLYRLALRAKLRRIPPHELRHCFATHMLDGGADIRHIQELLGHKCLTATQIYTHIARKKLVEVFDRCHPRGDCYHVQKQS